MALIPIKTASETGYCDCICGCYGLASLRDEDTGKGYCPACGKDHVDLNAGVGIPLPAPANVSANTPSSRKSAAMPSPAHPPGRLRSPVSSAFRAFTIVDSRCLAQIFGQRVRKSQERLLTTLQK